VGARIPLWRLKMQVKLAKTAGFCMGVRRAMGRVLEAAAKPGGRLVTYGPLIHNSQVTLLLEERNVAVVESPEQIRPGDRVAIRAHGVPPETRDAIRCRGASICDATCPHVARAQGLVKKAAGEGRDVIIVGDRGHAEVVGLLGFARGRGHVVESVDDVDHLPALDRVAVVAQTTQSEALFKAVEERVCSRFRDCEVHSTICGSTSDRQRETAELAAEVNVMVVVGGRHSANTLRLVQIAGATGRPTIHVESSEELREDTFRDYAVAGVTAGASTPNWVIEEVVMRLEGLHTARTHPILHRAIGAVDFFVRAGFLLAIGAGGLAYAAAAMLDRPFRALHFIIPVAYVFSMMNWNIHAELRAGEMVDRARALIFRRHGRLLTFLAAVLAPISLGLASLLGLEALFVLTLSSILGILYTIPVFPERLGLRYRRLKDLPGSRNLLFAGAIGVVTVILPLLDRAAPALAHPVPGIGVPLLLSFAIAFARSVVLDVKDLQSDVFAGRETIPVLIGKGGTKILLAAVLILAAAAIVSGALLGGVNPRALWQIPTICTICGILFLYHLRLIAYGILFHFILDATFLLAALATLVGKVIA